MSSEGQGDLKLRVIWWSRSSESQGNMLVNAICRSMSFVDQCLSKVRVI